jgi:hypothetical protein
LRRSFFLHEDVRRYVSTPQPIAFFTSVGGTAHALYVLPFRPTFERPLASDAVLDEPRGWSVDVNYRGSAGYGRPYRLRLEQQWGLVDVEDSVAGARSLVANPNADPARLMISGGSAGGYTTLRLLTPKGNKVLNAGASYTASATSRPSRETHISSSPAIWTG